MRTRKDYLYTQKIKINTWIRQNLTAHEMSKRLHGKVSKNQIIHYIKEDLRLSTGDREFYYRELLLSNKWDKELRV